MKYTFFRKAVLDWKNNGVRVMAWTVNSPIEKQYLAKVLKITYLTDTFTGEASTHSTPWISFPFCQFLSKCTFYNQIFWLSNQTIFIVFIKMDFEQINWKNSNRTTDTYEENIEVFLLNTIFAEMINPFQKWFIWWEVLKNIFEICRY